MAINQTITGFSVTPQRTAPATFSADTDTYHVELSTFIDETNTWKTEANATQEEINTSMVTTYQYMINTEGYVSTVTALKVSAETANTNAQISMSRAEQAYISTSNLITGLVIPTTATYSYEAADNKFNTKLRQFLNFKS